MLSMKIETLVSSVVNQFLLNNTARSNGSDDITRALHMHFDLRVKYHCSSAKIFGVSCGLHLLYYCTPGYSYVTVFSGVTDSPFDKIDKVENWKHECTHDSCWRDIGIFSEVYFSMAREINDARKLKGLEEVAPIDMSESNSFGGIVGPLFQWVPVEITKDSTDQYNYRKLIKLL